MARANPTPEYTQMKSRDASEVRDRGFGHVPARGNNFEVGSKLCARFVDRSKVNL